MVVKEDSSTTNDGNNNGNSSSNAKSKKGHHRNKGGLHHLGSTIDIMSGQNINSVIKHDKKHRLKQRFEVIRKLGQGTYGKVQLAINKETGQEVAIKTIKKSKIESEQDLIRIRREIQIMSSIQHPHIIHIFEVFENKEKIVLVMQYASGGELYEYVSERKVLTDEEARRLFRQIATAIYYCHKNKVCHRDLKLENILLDEKGNAKIGDFGLSNVFDERHFLNTFCGSPLYASPEIVKGTPYYGPEVDCWSMGVILYTLVYGAMPFDGSNFKRLVKQISDGSYFEPKDKSDASSLIKKLLTVNPAERATIIDICTDWWVNQNFEHTLLQVADDLANLTPVRLDVLLALAPISPSPSTADQPENAAPRLATGISGESGEAIATPKKNHKKTKPKRQEEILDEQSSQDISTDLPSYPEQDEYCDTSELADDNDSEFLSASAAAALDEAFQTQDDDSQSPTTKRAASTSFDKSMTRIPSQVAKKKKPKKAHKLIEEENSQPNSSGYISEATGQTETEKSTVTITPEPDIIVEETQKDAPQNDNSKSIISKPVEINNEKKEEIQLTPDEDKKESPNKLEDSKIEAMPLPSLKPKEEDHPPNQKILDIATGTETNSLNDESRTLGDEKKKPPLERKSSNAALSGWRKVGKLAIPKFLEQQQQNTSQTEKKAVPSYGSISDAKKMIFERRESLDKEKERVVPVVKVSDAKKAFERRMSMPSAPSLVRRSSVGPKSPEISNEEVEQPRSLGQTEKKNLQSSGRSLSVAEPLEAPKRVLEVIDNVSLDNKATRESTPNNNAERIKNKPVEINILERSQDTNKETSDPNKKNLAKEVLKKTISKARLVEKRQSSVESSDSVSTPVLIESPDVKGVKASYFKTPTPFTKGDPIKSVAEITLTPKTVYDKTGKGRLTQENLDPKLIKGMSPECLTDDASAHVETPKISGKAAPITRSYKKVTFTKDGKCITETGKIVSTEGADGTVTRVEKKSKVTHYPSEDSTSSRNQSFDESGSGTNAETIKSGSITPTSSRNTFPNREGVHKSESASSSGSIDIFDDIFDTWSGDPMFGNFPSRMRSMFQGRSPLTNLIKQKKRSKRKTPRAESCDRRPSEEWPSSSTKSGQHNLTDQESDTDNENESPFGACAPGGLWKFLKSPSSKMFDKHRDMLKRFDYEKGLFNNTDMFVPPAFTRSLSRNRPSFNTIITPQAYTVVPPSSSRTSLSTNNRAKLNESGEDPGTPRMFFPSMNSPGLSQRVWSKDEPEKEESEIDQASRRRVEQWLHMNPEEPVDPNNPISMYGTIRPRQMRQYSKALSSRLSREFDELDRGNENENKFVASREFHMGNENQQRRPQNISPDIQEHFTRTPPIATPRHIEMGLSFSPMMAPSIFAQNSLFSTFSPSMASMSPQFHPLSRMGMNIVNQTSSEPSSTTLASEMAGDNFDWDSPVQLPESSSLLEQLRTHGYKNLVTQRLTGVKDDPLQKYDQEPGAYKGGKKNSVSSRLNSSSGGMMNGACNGLTHDDGDNDCMAMMTNKIKNGFHNAATCAPVSTASTDATANNISIEPDLNHIEGNKSPSQPNPHPNKRSLIIPDDGKVVGAPNPPFNPPSAESGSEKLTITTDSALNHRSIQLTNTTTPQETVQERILRKSFYSRVNDEAMRRRSTSRPRRRSSLIDGQDINKFFGFPSTMSNNMLRPSSSSLSYTPSSGSFQQKQFLQGPSHSVPGSSTLGDDWYQKMEGRASQLLNSVKAKNLIPESHKSRSKDRFEDLRRRSMSNMRNSFFPNSLIQSDDEDDDTNEHICQENQPYSRKKLINYSHENSADKSNKLNSNSFSKNPRFSTEYQTNDNSLSQFELVNKRLDNILNSRLNMSSSRISDSQNRKPNQFFPRKSQFERYRGSENEDESDAEELASPIQVKVLRKAMEELNKNATKEEL